MLKFYILLKYISDIWLVYSFIETPLYTGIICRYHYYSLVLQRMLWNFHQLSIIVRDGANIFITIEQNSSTIAAS